MKTAEDLSIFPPRFVSHVTKNSDCNKLNSKIKITLYIIEEIKSMQSAFFKLIVPMSPSIKHYSTNVSDRNHPVPPHHCKQNKPAILNLMEYSKIIVNYWKKIAAVLGIQDDIDAIDYNNCHVEDKCYDMFKIWLRSTINPCWCHFIQALHNVGLYPAAEDAITNIVRMPETETMIQSPGINVQEELISTKQLKLLESESVPPTDLKLKTMQTHLDKNVSLMTPSGISEGSSKIADDKLNLPELKRYLKHIPDNDLDYFIFCLFYNKDTDSGVNVIEDIKLNSSSLSKEDTVEKVCEAYLTVKNPSWTEVHRALEDAGCNSLARFVKAIFLTKRI